MIVRAALFAFAFALCAAGCPTECSKCESDADCRHIETARAGELVEYCLFGQCQQCAADAHCASGRCNRGRCVDKDVVDGGSAIVSQDAGR